MPKRSSGILYPDDTYKTWGYIIDVGRDAQSGKRKQKRKRGFATKKEAEKARTAALNSVHRGEYLEVTKQTVLEFIEEWLETIRPTVAPATHATYKRHLSNHFLPYLGHVPLAALDAGMLTSLQARLLASGRKSTKGHGTGLSPTTVGHVHSAIGRALKDAERWGRISRNVARQVDKPKAPSLQARQHETWDAETMRTFLEASLAEQDYYYAAWYLLITTGMRRGEALGARWSDLDLTNSKLSIVQTSICVEHQQQFSTPKTDSGVRPISIDPGTMAVLKEHRRSQLEQRMLLGEGWQDHDLIFTKVDGSPLHPERFSREFDRRVIRYCLPRITPHGLRHSWATLALENGVPAKVVQERLGHSNIVITLQTYSHVSETMHDDAADRISSLISGTS